MSFGKQKEESVVDVTRLRRNLREMWKLMQSEYRQGNPMWWNVPFPELVYVEEQRKEREPS